VAITAEEGALFIMTENGNRLLAIENSLHKFVSELDKKILLPNQSKRCRQ